MKKILLIIFIAVASQLNSQDLPDTIWVESLTDTTFLIATGTMNARNNKLNIKYIDNVFDSAGVAEFAFNRIDRNEHAQRDADLIKLKADALTALYTDVNSILQNFTGSGYLGNSFQKYRHQLIGYYSAQLGASQIFVQLNADATAVQINAQGEPIGGGFLGTWDIINQSRFRLKNFFPANILPAGSVFNRLENPDTVFMAVGSNVILTKIQ